jgi:hypothetical protein
MKCDSWAHSWPASSQALALVASLCLGHKPKVKVVTNWFYPHFKPPIVVVVLKYGTNSNDVHYLQIAY